MNRLKEERKKMRKNQTEIAKKLHISQQAYSDYENEDTKPTRDMMIAVSKVFGKPISYLFCLDENFEQPGTEEKENEQENLTEEQKALIEKIKGLDDTQCKQLSSYADRLVVLNNQEEEKVKNLFKQKYINKYKNLDD